MDKSQKATEAESKTSEIKSGRKWPLHGTAISWKQQKIIWAYLFVSLPFLYIFIVDFVAMLVAFSFSLEDFNTMNRSSTFTGLANYVAIFTSKDFFQSLKNTLLFAVYRVPTIIVLALIIAILLKRIRILKGFFRMLFFIPYVTSSVAISWVFRFMYLPNFGIFTPIYDFLKIPRQDPLGTPDTALLAIVVVTIWSSVGLYILLFLAGLEDIPSEYYDASMVDGANPWQRFRYITMPLLNRTIVLNTTLCLVNSLQTFTYVRMLSADNGMGGPLGATRTLPILIYKEAFYSLKMGRASAISFVFFLIILAFSLAQRRIMTRDID